MSFQVAPLVQFTDEELLLLGADHPVVDTPYLSSLQPAQRALAAQVAYRSLCSHGAVAVDGGAGMELPESYVTMLRLRAAATSVLVVSKATVDAGIMRYHHLGDDTVVLEDVSDAGAHEFRLVDHRNLVDALRSFCTVDGAADGAGEPVLLRERSFAGGDSAAELWGDGVAQFDATVWRAAASSHRPAPVLGFLLGSSASWHVHRVAGPGQDDGTVELTPIRATDVAEAIARTLLIEEDTEEPPHGWHLMRA